MRPELRCVIDRSQPCGACIAPSPRECPYTYLLDADERAAAIRASRPSRRPASARSDARC